MRIKDQFQNYLDYLHQKGLTNHTIVEHKRFVDGAISHARLSEKFLKNKKVKDLKLTDTASVIEAGKVHGVFGSQRAVCVWRSFLRYLKADGIKLPFDIEDLEVPEVPGKPVEWLSEKELKRLFSSFNLGVITGLRTRTLLEVLYATGMRVGEALSLNIKDIDFDKQEVTVTGKGGQIDKVYFTKRSLYWIKRYLTKRKGDHPALFVNESGKDGIKRAACRSYLRAHARRLGFRQHICHHLMRRTFATHLVQRGANIKEVQYLCRHKSERTTLRVYVGIDKAKAKITHQKLLDRDF